MLRNSIRSVLRLAQADRPHTQRSWALALFAAAEAALSVLILIFGYAWAGRHDALWAVVTAVLVVQPGFRQSLVASVTRVIANIAGALTALIIGLLVKDPNLAVILSLIVVILLCELLRLDLGVRPACASVIIVLMAGNGPIWGSSMHRVSAVAIGCGVAILVQFLSAPFVRKIDIAMEKINKVPR
jgi:uncharacterized membrane protein YgaE (UPF0421/DUF939 family)